MIDEIRKKIDGALKRYVEQKPIEVVDVKISSNNNHMAIQILADHRSGGISLDECTALNKFITGHIEEEEWITDQFTVEVSSPGIDWPLNKKSDFDRTLGRKVQFQLNDPVDSKQDYIGIVREVLENEVIIDSKKTEVTIPFQKIENAVQVI